MDLFHNKEEIRFLWKLTRYANSLLDLANPRKDIFIQMYVNTIKQRIQNELTLYSNYIGLTVYQTAFGVIPTSSLGNIINIKRFTSTRVIVEVKFVICNEPLEVDLATLILA